MQRRVFKFITLCVDKTIKIAKKLDIGLGGLLVDLEAILKQTILIFKAFIVSAPFILYLGYCYNDEVLSFFDFSIYYNTDSYFLLYTIGLGSRLSH